jgi:hypothetical protein
MRLNESQRTVIVAALRVAAEEYSKAAKVCATEPGHDRMAAQFLRQETEARDLADAIEQAETVEG